MRRGAKRAARRLLRRANAPATLGLEIHGPVEVDDFYVGGIEEGRGGGRKSDSSKAIVAAAVELRGAGSGRLRLSVIPDLSAASLCGFVTEVVERTRRWTPTAGRATGT